MHFSTLVSAAAFAAPALAGYVLEDDYMKDFYGSFDFWTEADPTHGFVKYVDEATSRSMNLIDSSTTVPVKWGVDTVNKDPEGRASIRLTSKKSYNKGLVIIDIEHMPFGCGTWPAFWMVGPNWPNQGEIDIVEGVNEQDANAITLHTGPGCAIQDDSSLFSGAVQTQNCDVKAQGQAENAGCSIKQKSPQSYGAGLNDNGGGVFATEWTGDAISVYFFPRGSVPEGVLGDSPDPSTWGTPSAKFAKSSCDIDGIFKDLQIVFDTTFCGDWAGNTWSSSSCASKAPTCNDFVRDNPDAFQNAFWTVNALKVYSNDPNAQAPETPATPSQGSPDIQQPPVSSEEPSPVPEEPTPFPGASATSGPAPIEPAPTDDGEQSPPILPTSSPAPSGILQENPDGTVFIPDQGSEPSGAPVFSADAPASTGAPTPSQSGSFQWPGLGKPHFPISSIGSGVMSILPANLPNDTAMPTPATGFSSFSVSIPTELQTGNSPSETGNSQEVWETVYTTQMVTVTGQGPAPSAAPPAEDDDVQTVWQTAWQTFYVTVDPSQPSAAARMGRRERQHRRRMVQHNARR